MAYEIRFVGLSEQGTSGMLPLTDGYQARDLLPAYDAVTFETEAAAQAWIAANQRGPVDGLFRIEPGV